MSRLYVYKLAGLELVVGQIPQAILVTTGLVEVVAPSAALAAIYVTFRLFVSKSGPRLYPKDWSQRSWCLRIVWVIGAVIAGLVIWAAIAVNWLALRHGGCVQNCGDGFLKAQPGVLDRLQPVGFWVTALIVICAFLVMGFLVFARVGEVFHSRWHTVRPIAMMTLVWSTALLPAYIAYDATLPLAGVRVCTIDGTFMDGYLVAQTSDAVFIADQQIGDSHASAARRLITIPASRVTEVISGGSNNKLACPAKTTP